MKEYIERALAVQELEVLRQEYEMHDDCDELVARRCRDAISALPAADVVEVIRCHNCKRIYANANDPGVIYCGWSKEPTPPDGYCHRGERTNGQGG